MPAIVERETGSVLMIVDDLAEAETIMFELRRKGVAVDVVKLPGKGGAGSQVGGTNSRNRRTRP